MKESNLVVQRLEAGDPVPATSNADIVRESDGNLHYSTDSGVVSFPPGDEPWQTPTLLNGWVNFGAGYTQAAYRRVGNKVILRGLIKTGSSIAFTLPVGYRPTALHHLSTVSYSGVATVNVYSDGTVNFGTGASTTWTSLDGVEFYID